MPVALRRVQSEVETVKDDQCCDVSMEDCD